MPRLAHLLPLLLIALPLAGIAQTPPAPRDSPGIAYQDTVAMLVVLVRYQDDTWGDCERWWCHLAEWPHSDFLGTGETVPWTRLPDWAPTLLEPRPTRVRADSLSLADPTLSAYFYWQSHTGPDGPHVLYGDVWPEVYITQHPNRAYYNRRDSAGVSLPQRGGFGYLTAEVLDALTAQGLDLGRYDHDRDGVLDHLAMIVRRDSIYRGQGWAMLQGVGVGSGLPDRDGDGRSDRLRYWSPSRGDSVRVDWFHSGSQYIAHDGRRKLFIHEYGHRLFNHSGHLAMLRHDPARRGAEPCGYARMCGVPNTYDGAAVTLSVHERRRMGWLRPLLLDPADGDREGIVLRDLYAFGDAALVPLGSGVRGDTLELANRQRLGYFDRDHGRTSLHPDYDYVYEGLATTGLHVSVSQGDPRGPEGRYRYGMLPADGTYEHVSRCSGAFRDCHGPGLYDGDFFGPDTEAQLTPWTRPNSSGYARMAHLPASGRPEWFALDRFRYLPGPDGALQFDFVDDVRYRPSYLGPDAPWPVFRADSWLGPESDGLVFVGTAGVEPGVVLYVGADDRADDEDTTRHASLGAVRVVFRDGLRLAPGAWLVIGPEADVQIERGPVGGPGANVLVEPGGRLTLGPGLRLDGTRHERAAPRPLRRPARSVAPPSRPRPVGDE